MVLKLEARHFSSAALILGCAGLSALLALYSPLALEGARNGLALCGQVIIPSMYPFFVLAGIFSRLDGARGPNAALGVILLGFLGGYPLGVKTAAQLLERGAVSRAGAQRLQLFCVNAGPAYLIGAVGAGMLGSRRAGAILFASMLVSGLVIGGLAKFLPLGEGASLRETTPTLRRHPSTEGNEDCNKPFDHILLTAVTQATGAVLGVCAWVVLFSALCALLRLLPRALWPAIPTLNVLLEVSSGAAAVVRSGMPLPVLCAALGWGGIAVHCQLLGDIRKTGLPLRLFWASRLLHGALAAAVCTALLRRFPMEMPAAAMWGAGHGVRLWAVSAPAAAAALFFCAFLILDLDLGRKVC